MDLSTTQQIVLIILSSALAIFLILSVVAAVLAIKLIQTLRTIAKRAEQVVESASHVGHMFKSVSGPMGMFRFIKSVVDMVQKDKRSN